MNHYGTNRAPVSDETFARIIDTLADLEAADGFGVSADDVARWACLTRRNTYEALREAERLGCVVVLRGATLGRGGSPALWGLA